MAIVAAVVVLRIEYNPLTTDNVHNWNWNALLDMKNDESVAVLVCEDIAEENN